METLDPDVTKPSAGPAFRGELSMGNVVEWEDLCGPCYKAVSNLFDAIAKKVDGMSPDRKEGVKRAKKKEAAAEQPSPPPAVASTAGGQLTPTVGPSRATTPRSV